MPRGTVRGGEGRKQNSRESGIYGIGMRARHVCPAIPGSLPIVGVTFLRGVKGSAYLPINESITGGSIPHPFVEGFAVGIVTPGRVDQHRLRIATLAA
jgi:hypothetical protein